MNKTRYTILFEDEWLIVVDKTPGVLIIPTPKAETNTLTDLLNRELAARGVEVKAHPCHRLDRDTSGLIIYAKGKKAQALMMDEFRKRAVKKTYVAFVHGKVRKNFGALRGAIYPAVASLGGMSQRQKGISVAYSRYGLHNRNKGRGEHAETRYKVLERMKDFTVLEAEPVTGRTNQIRIHMKDMGHPLLGERVYAFGKDYKLKFRRLALHARRIEFIHPFTKERMAFTSPLPTDMKGFFARYALSPEGGRGRTRGEQGSGLNNQQNF